MFEAFQIGPFILWTHLIFLLIGFWMSAEFLLKLAQGSNLSLQHFREYAWQYIVAFVLGGRLFAILGDYRLYVKDPLRSLILWDGNFSFLGAAIGVACVLWWVSRQSRVTFLQWMDVLLPATTFGLSFDWLGKFAAGQDYGKPSDMFWAVTYESPTVRYTVPIQPVQLYYALFFFVLTFVLLVVRKHSKRAGAETLFGIALASVATLALETFRGDFGVPVFATKLDFFILVMLFLSLGIFAAIELNISQRMMIAYEVAMTAIVGVYFFIRPSLDLVAYQLRFSQFLAVLALFGTVVYVVVHRRRHPHL